MPQGNEPGGPKLLSLSDLETDLHQENHRTENQCTQWSITQPLKRIHLDQMRWMKLEPIIQSEVSQKEKHQYSILTHVYGI